MSDEFKGISKVFSFTFARHTGTKGYRRTTGFVALALFLIPVAIFAGIALLGDDEAAPMTYGCGAETIYVADSTEETDYGLLNSLGNTDFVFEYIPCSSADEAFEKAAGNDKSLVLAVEKDEYNYDISVILPENSALSEDDSSAFGEFISMNFSYILMAKSGVSAEQLAALYSPPTVNVPFEENFAGEIPFEEENSGNGETDNFVVYITCYLNIMVLYFMVLFYGTGVANSVIIEKTSKLMDFFLVTVKPGAMVLGKVFAVTLAGIIQIFIWAASVVLGVLSGAFIGGKLSPEVEAAVSSFLEVFDFFSGMFSIPSIILALLITFSGMLLYSALASVGGSLASKPEDLSSTNQIFTLVLVISFFAVLFTGGNGEFISSAEWLNWIPFTAVLITPGRILAGEVSLIEGAFSLALIIVFSVAVTWFAGKVYKMMSLYKGDPPKISKVFEMMKNSK